MALLHRFLKKGVIPRLVGKQYCAYNDWMITTRLQSTSARAAVKAAAPVGAKLSGFRVLEVKDIEELQLTAVRLKHKVTGASYLHIAKDDPNNVFCIGFRTTPLDSTGVPHILEHTVLCGSKKYPVRDPFFKMLNRSLSTFMNAMTGSDYTIYPFSTQNDTDFRNLMSVYLDAVFKPNLLELDFCQEGWRLEHADPNDKNSPLEFKGVVFNEMKGVFADSQNVFMEKLQNSLLPSHTYGVVAGGYPLDIPKLSWEQLKDFHKLHYHPSNSRIFTYGDQNLLDHLEFIDKNYLHKFSKIDPNTDVPDEPRWSKPRTDHIYCGVDPLAKTDAQTTVAISYLATDITDYFESFIMSILGELLISGPNAPFYKSLLESQYGTSFSPGSGYSGHTRNTMFTIGLQGTKEDSTEEILTAIDNTFNRVKKEGFSKERIESILHSIELGVKHQTANFGIRLSMSLAPLWNQDGDVIKALEINEAVSKFRQCLADNPKFLQEKVNSYFIKNQHRYTLTMSPKKDYEEKLKQKEAKLLDSRVKKLSAENKEKIWQRGQTLAAKQNAVQDLSCLPTLHTSDIKKNIPGVAVTQLKLSQGVSVQICPQPTNDVSYFYAVLDVQTVPADLLPFVPLFCGILTKMGAGGLNFREFDQQAELSTGGLTVSTHLEQHLHNYNIEKGILLSSHCLHQNLPKMFKLWEKVINELNMADIDRFSTLVKMISSDNANSVIQMGHRYAMQCAASTTSMYGAVKEDWSGLSNVSRLKKLSDTEDLQPTLEKLRQLSSIVLGKQNLRVAMNVTPNHSDSALKELELFLNNLPGTPAYYNTHPAIDNDAFTPHTSRLHHIFPFPVNYTAKAVAGVPYTHPDAGPLRVLGRIMYHFLHREIREKGGAYGGGASASPGGPFYFYSYRDPNTTQTFAAFNAAIEWVLKGSFSDREVEEAKLGVFQSIDAPVSPGSRGMRNFLSQISDEMFAEHRRSVLEAEAPDIIRVARVHLKDCLIEGDCLIGPQNKVYEEDPFWKCVQQG